MTNGTWRYSTDNGERLYVIGDIHGEFNALRKILAGISSDLQRRPTNQYRIIFLGDFVDRGDNSSAVIDLLISLSDLDHIIILRGNHEAMLLSILDQADGISEWRNYGGLETLNSFGVAIQDVMKGRGIQIAHSDFVQKFGQARRSFIEALPYSYQSGDYYFCHAGVRPGKILAEQTPQDLMWIREPFLSHNDPFEKLIIHGHTPIEQIEIKRNRINIDTGAYLTQRLTCLVLEKSRVSSFDSLDPEINDIV